MGKREHTVNPWLVLAENSHLETKRLRLRPVTLADAAAMYQYASDDETVRFVFPKHTSIESTKKEIASYFLKEPLGKYGIELKENNVFIGTIDLRMIQPFCAEIGYTLNKAYWGYGYMPEACEVLKKLAFEQLKISRLQAVHDARNPKSGRVMEKIGMKKEGLLRQSSELKGEIVDEWMYSMMLGEYQQ